MIFPPTFTYLILVPTESEDKDEDAHPAKAPRMKTNKVCRLHLVRKRHELTSPQQKASNFYSGANVKNKNRSKAAHLRSLPTGKKGQAGRGPKRR